MTVTTYLLTWVVLAHVELTNPPQRYPEPNQLQLDLKAPPCGRDGNPPGEVPRTVFAPGATITVTWDEFVPHPGHFRIAFDDDGDDDLLDPSGYDDLYTPGVTILADGIPHEDGKQFYAYEIQLPEIECTTCTLQLIQVMTDKPPWGPAGGTDIYYQCADIALMPAGGDGGGTGGGGTGTTAPGTGSASGAATHGETGPGTTGPGTTGGTSADADADGAGGTGCRCRSAPLRERPPAVATAGLVILPLRRRPRRGAAGTGRDGQPAASAHRRAPSF